MKRRHLLKAAAVSAISPLTLGLVKPLHATAGTFQNEDFLTNGEFDEEKAKDGVLALCKQFGYPIFPGLRENLWVSDYGAGQFATLGLAAYLFENHAEDGTYMLMDVFLLPNQMLPEHWHLEGDLGITKNEGWLIRWGKSYVVGIGEDNMDDFPQINVPSFHCGGTTQTHHVVEATPGKFVPLAKLKSPHWQYGGPKGAILTEVANYHTNAAVRHSDPKLNEFFLNS
ncbi:MAG: hypothetical protein R6U98_31840 [Pirellulaceae bacterium]